MERITDTVFHGGREAHLYKYQNGMKKAVNDGRITEQDSILIKSFLSEIQACNDISAMRIYKLSYQLIGMRKWLPPFVEITTSVLFAGIEDYKNNSGYKDNTQGDMIKILKRFLIWLVESEEANPGLNIAKIGKIKAKTVTKTKTAEDVLTKTEVDAIFKAASSTRNRAILELLYESAGRIGEICTLQWSQITFYNTHASVHLSGKTGKTRVVPLYTSHVILRRWRDQYSGGTPKPTDLVFPSKLGCSKPLWYNSVQYMIEQAAKRAGIERKVNPHIFRHSKITHYKQDGISDSTVKMLAWGDIGSNMLSTYAHLTVDDADRELMQFHGIVPAEELSQSDDALTPQQCKQCGMLNPQSNEFCGGCGFPLRSDTANTMAELQRVIDTDPDLLQRIAHMLQPSKKQPET